MRTIDGATRLAWLSGDYTGDRRPMMRATIASLNAITVPYKTQVYCATVWGQQAQPVELPNIKSVKWSRSLDSDAATCTLELYNTEPMPLGQTPSPDGELDIPGYYTYNRGKTDWSTARFGQQPTGWHDRIVPDRIIRTYEGYGFNATLAPENDPHMYLSGVWMVDTVEYTHNGLITVTCRDLTRLLLDQIAYVPVIPFKHYPLHFTAYYQVQNPPTHVVSGTTKFVRPAFSGSSTTPYVGLNGSVYGHRGTDAFDASLSTYWLSTGNAVPNADYSYEWIEGKIKSNTVSAIKFKVWGGPYRVYVSVYANGKWQGDQTVPYNPDDPIAAPNGANIRYVTAFSVGDGVLKSYKFASAFTGVTKIRLTFTHLYNSGLGPFVYRAGCRDFQVCVGTQVVETADAGTHQEGNYGDFTDIVKLLLAYGGFYWPSDTKRAVRRQSDGTYVNDVGPDDPYLVRGSVWGVMQATNTAGIVPLQADIFDKSKSLMDCINYIRDIVGFVFFVDEYGGAVWRLGNVWQVGNYIRDNGGSLSFTPTVEELDERTVLLGLRAKLDSRNVREKIFIANVSGRVGAVSNGFNPYPSGLRRVGGWTDQNFKNASECQIMADMIVVQQMYSYRSDNVTIAGYPGIQIDDQVRVFERVTNEGYLHYVRGIDCSWDLESGKYIYELTTNWLGVTPYSNWVIDPSQLAAETKQYLNNLGVPI